MSEESGFTVTDRRRVRSEAAAESAVADAEAAAAAAEAEAATAEAEAATAEAAAGVAEAEAAEAEAGFADEADEMGDFVPNFMGRLTVSDILRMTVGMLNEKAWVSMGLLPNPASGQIERDLAEARRAIDVLTDLARHLEADASPEERRELQTLTSNARLNFVRQSSQPG